jgi:hypothetical protein
MRLNLKVRNDLAQKRGIRVRSAKGAEYDSQGQALSGAKRVAAGSQKQVEVSTERAKYHRYLLRSFRASRPF